MTEHPSPIPSATLAGHVRSTGDVVAGPSAWLGERTETGHYTIHHNIGSLDYIVIVQALVTPTQAPAFAVVTEEQPDYLAYRIVNADGEDANHDAQIFVVLGA